MPEDLRTDETLIEAYQNQGDNNALDTLILRYQTPLWNNIRHLSWNKHDKSQADDTLEDILIAILQGIKSRRFKPGNPGSFKAWAYDVCRKLCWKANERQSRRPQTLTQRFPEDMPENLVDLRPVSADEGDISPELKKALSKIPDEDWELLLMKAGYSYEEIHAIFPYSQYELAKLRQKVCRARKYLLHLMEEIKHDSEAKK